MSQVKALIFGCGDKRLINDYARFEAERGWSEQAYLHTAPGDCYDLSLMNTNGQADCNRLIKLFRLLNPEHLVIIAHQDCAVRKDAGIVRPATPAYIQQEICAEQLQIVAGRIFAVAHRSGVIFPKVELFFARQKRDNPEDFDFLPVEA